MSNLIRRVLALQGTLYLITGLRPIARREPYCRFTWWDAAVELGFVAGLVYAFHREFRERAEAPLLARRAIPT